MLALTAWIPRGWVLLGALTVGPAFLAGVAIPKLAISLGGVLLAYRALRQMVEGLADLAGDKLVLEGRSGSGKSTLAAILGGLRTPDTGLVHATGLDLRTLGARGWRERVALAPQFHENHVFGGSLLFNLLMGRSWPPSADDVRDAEHMCRRLGLGPLLERMPAGILQWVGETGWRLSHGERARVWIARALLQGAQAVVVDEGLDALDPHSLRQVQRVLSEERAAVLVIAHP